MAKSSRAPAISLYAARLDERIPTIGSRRLPSPESPVRLALTVQVGRSRTVQSLRRPSLIDASSRCVSARPGDPQSRGRPNPRHRDGISARSCGPEPSGFSPTAPPSVKICSELDVSAASCRLCGECNNNNNNNKNKNNNNNNVRTNYKFSAPLNLALRTVLIISSLTC